MTAPRGESEGRYLKVKVLDFLDRRLGVSGTRTWRQLAGELDFTSMDVDKLEADGLKIDQSSTKLLLRQWECREGGCNVELLKENLLKIGRKDILRDLCDEYEKQGIELVEPRSSPTTMGKIPQDGQDERIAGNIELVESRSGPTTNLQIPLIDGEVLLIGKVYKVRKSPLQDKRNSDPDPIIGEDLSTSGNQSWSSGSVDRIPGLSNSPKNLRKTTSSQLPVSEEPCQIHRTITSPIPRDMRREVESHQNRGDYGSLHSEHRSVRDAPGDGGACPGKQYLVVSSDNEQDKLWSKKLCKILNKKGHQASWLHDVHPGRYRAVFHQVQYVLVIYTEKYKKDFQTNGTRNQILFQEMQIEYRTNSRVNHRFIPVYDVGVIRQLPDALLNGNATERNYILGLLSGKHPRGDMHSSAPSRGTRTEPVIVREYHSPQIHAKKGPFWKKK